MSGYFNGEWGWSASLIAGVAVAHLFVQPPPSWSLLALALTGLLLLTSAGGRVPGLFLLALAWSLLQFQLRLADRLDNDLAGEVLFVEGVISSVPQEGEDSTRFRFDPARKSLARGLPESLLVTWYRERPPVRAGQRWLLEMKVQPPWGRVNFLGADKEQWLFAQGIGGTGSVRRGTLLSVGQGTAILIQRTREEVINRVATSVAEPASRGIIQALATADRSSLADTEKTLLRDTGTGHLLAISGLHVGLAALAGMWLCRCLFWLMPVSRLGSASYAVSMAGGLLAAMSYTFLAGLAVSALRAMLMLSCLAAASALSRRIHPFRAWITALALILVADPFAPLGAGFWFSFAAVAALIWRFDPFCRRQGWARSLLSAQWAVFLVLLPFGAAWFQAVSPIGFAANLFAIPWVSLTVVPAVLAGVASLAFSTDLAALFWDYAGSAISVLLWFLQLMAQWQGEQTALNAPSRWHLAAAVLGAFLLMLPRGLSARWCGLFLLLPLLLPVSSRLRSGEIELEVLDVGQGTAVRVTTRKETLLYDTGPGDGGGLSLVPSVIAPALRGRGVDSPARVVISHGDLDHAGGAGALLRRFPGALYLVNHRDDLGGGGCTDQVGWKSEGFSFRALHPSSHLPYLGNGSSCVVSVRGGNASLLLTGDIPQVIEKRLLSEGLNSHAIVLVPHHGSLTSSSPEFIERVQPAVAIATASLGNRFGFPRNEVRQRYLQRGASFWSTGECGAIRLRIKADGSWVASSARRDRARIWRWPAGAECP